MAGRATMLLGVLVPLVALGAGVATEQSATTVPTVLDGVFTAEQAAAGHTLYDLSCKRCHEGSEADGPLLLGRTFINRWREDTLEPLYDHIRNRMPPGVATHLTDDQYIQALSYLLDANGYPAGSKALTPETIATTLVVGPDGPKPLPQNTLVQVAGCLQRDGATAWMLKRATAPMRMRPGSETAEEQRRRFDAKPHGDRDFTVQSFTNIDLNFDPAPFEGKRIAVNGVLVQNRTRDRINVVALHVLTGQCQP